MTNPIKSRVWWITACGLGAVVAFYFVARYSCDFGVHSSKFEPTCTLANHPKQPELHSLAISALVVRANANEQLTPADIQTLLAFISAPKPGDLTDGEWEERVNVILNLLRRQTEDVETEDRRREDASSLAGSGAGHGVTAAATVNPSATSASPVFAEATPGKLRFDSNNDGIDWTRVDGILETASRRLVGEAGAGVNVRISAVHACVDRKDAGALPDLRKVAADPSLVSTLRKAAIHAIGQLGTAEDMALLDSLPQDDQNLSQALTPAKAALKTRTEAAR